MVTKTLEICDKFAPISLKHEAKKETSAFLIHGKENLMK